MLAWTCSIRSSHEVKIDPKLLVKLLAFRIKLTVAAIDLSINYLIFMVSPSGFEPETY